MGHRCVSRDCCWRRSRSPTSAGTYWAAASITTVYAARSVVGTAYGFALAGERKLEVGAARAVITHAGYLAGSFLGGAALALGGRSTVGVAFALLFLAATSPYLSAWSARCP